MENLLTDIVYKRAGGAELHSDVYFPSCRKREPSPVWFYTHGGGWTQGNKKEPQIFPLLLKRISANGITLVSIEYRLCNENVHFPVPANDCSDAIRYFIERALKYKIDPARAFTGGTSAGGHLALLMGFAAEQYGDCKGLPLPEFRCIVDICGPVDLNCKNRIKNVPGQIFYKFLSQDRDKWPELAISASPITYARALPPEKLIPVIAIHGQNDRLVDKEQPEVLRQLYENRGAHFEIMRVENANHVFGRIPELPAPSASVEEIQDRIFDFIDRFVLQK